MEKEDTISVQRAQEDVETSYNLLNNNISQMGCLEIMWLVTVTIIAPVHVSQRQQ